MTSAVSNPTFQEWFALRPELLWAYEGPVDPRYRHHLSAQRRRLNAWLLLSGGVQLISQRIRITAHQGQWVLFSSVMQQQDFSPQARLVSVSFRLSGVDERYLDHPPMVVPAKKFPRLASAARGLAAEVQRFLPSTKTELSSQRVSHAGFLQINRRFARWTEEYFRVREMIGTPTLPRRKLDPRVAVILENLETAPLSQIFSEEGLAESVGLSAGHLERLFVRELGATPRHLWEERRKEYAGQQVLHSDLPFKQLAYELGFSSPQHFSNWFHRNFGMSPRNSRRRQRDESAVAIVSTPR